MHSRTNRWARWMAWLVMAAAMVSCATAEAAAPSPEAGIVRSMQGVQLDVWGGGAPAPGRTTTMFVHHGDRAAELYWTTDGWCLARVLRWTVEDAQSATSFTIRYVAVEQHTACLMDSGDVELLRVVEVHDGGGPVTMTGLWTTNDTWTVRTRCSEYWDAPAPCGFIEAFALVPSL